MSHSAIRNWADAEIETVTIAAPWQIDLSFAELETVDYALQQVPGQANKIASARLLCILLAIRWRDGDVDIDTVRRIGWDLHMAEQLQLSDGEHSDWGVQVEVECEGLAEGYNTQEQVSDLITRCLDRYIESKSELPP